MIAQPQRAQTQVVLAGKGPGHPFLKSEPMNREIEIHAALEAEQDAFKRKRKADESSLRTGSGSLDSPEADAARTAQSAWKEADAKVAELNAEYRERAHALGRSATAAKPETASDLK